MSRMYRRTKNDPRITPARGNPAKAALRSAKGRASARRRNPWKVQLTKKAFPWHKVAMPVLAVFLPLFLLLAADNLAFRLPDLYNYYMLDTRVLSEKMVAADEEAVAQLISGYINHRTDQFQMKENLEYLPDDLFTAADGEMAAALRRALDYKAMAAGGALLLAALALLALLRLRERDRILHSFYYSLPVFLGYGLLNAATLLAAGLRVPLYGIAGEAPEGAPDLLPSLLDPGFFRFSVLAGAGLSLVLLGLCYYAVWMVSGRKVTFRR